MSGKRIRSERTFRDISPSPFARNTFAIIFAMELHCDSNGFRWPKRAKTVLACRHHVAIAVNANHYNNKSKCLNSLVCGFERAVIWRASVRVSVCVWTVDAGCVCNTNKFSVAVCMTMTYVFVSRQAVSSELVIRGVCHPKLLKRPYGFTEISSSNTGAMPLSWCVSCSDFSAKAAASIVWINLCAKSTSTHTHTHSPAHTTRLNKRTGANPSKPSIQNSLQHIRRTLLKTVYPSLSTLYSPSFTFHI